MMKSNKSKMLWGVFVVCTTLTGCFSGLTPEPVPKREQNSVCRTPIPLELRLRRMQQRLNLAYAHAPSLSQDEHNKMSQLAQCYGVAALGVGNGCAAGWDKARASGLVERNRIRSAQYTIPENVLRAATKPLGASRTSDLLVAMLTVRESQGTLREYLKTKLSDKQRQDLSEGAVFVHEPSEVVVYRNDPLELMLVSDDIQQAIICDVEDLVLGHKRGATFDPASPIPAGP